MFDLAPGKKALRSHVRYMYTPTHGDVLLRKRLTHHENAFEVLVLSRVAFSSRLLSLWPSLCVLGNVYLVLV